MDVTPEVQVNKPDVLPVPFEAKVFHGQMDQLEYCLKLRPPGAVLEFGVAKGHTTNWIAKCVGRRWVYGFDSFKGLPTDWERGNNVFKRRHFNTGGVPSLASNVRLVVGWFHETLPAWLAEHKNLIIGFMHIDCDLYESTKTVLALTKPYLAHRAVLVFDELADFKDPQEYTNWRQGEYRALQEELPHYEIISRNQTYGVGIRLEPKKRLRLL